MNLKQNKQIIQDIYDKGLFLGISYRNNKIFVSVKDGKSHKSQEIKTDYPLRDFEALKTFVETIKVSVVKDDSIEENPKDD